MKVHYNEEQDILMIELANSRVDDAYETENMIVHVSSDKQPVLLEIFNGSKLLKQAALELPKKIRQELFSSTPSVAHSLKR